MATKLRIISRLTGAIRPARTPPSSVATPYSVVMPLPPWTWIAVSTARVAASEVAYFAMLAATPASRSRPAS